MGLCSLKWDLLALPLPVSLWRSPIPAGVHSLGAAGELRLSGSSLLGGTWCCLCPSCGKGPLGHLTCSGGQWEPCWEGWAEVTALGGPKVEILDLIIKTQLLPWELAGLITAVAGSLFSLRSWGAGGPPEKRCSKTSWLPAPGALSARLAGGRGVQLAWPGGHSRGKGAEFQALG